MRTVKIADTTLNLATEDTKFQFTFRKKQEVARILDKMGITVSLGNMSTQTADILLIKSLAAEIKNTTLAVCPELEDGKIESVWNALKEAKKPRLQILAGVSTARMEYVYGKKAKDMLLLVENSIKKASSLCSDVEFIAEDATRADFEFLKEIIKTAILSGAKTITVCDTAGTMLPHEFGDYIKALYDEIDKLKDVTLGVDCSDNLNSAVASATCAIYCGACEVKTSTINNNNVSLLGISKVIETKGDMLGAKLDIDLSGIVENVQKIINLGAPDGSQKSPFNDGVREHIGEATFTKDSTEEALFAGIKSLGHQLDDDDKNRVFSAFLEVAKRKDEVSLVELDAIVASHAMQVPETYTLVNYIVTTGNAIDILAHVKLKKDGKLLDGLSLGDGPIDAAFLAIESITGHHYELDDFQIRAISEGREAMGQTLVKLRSNGKIYSGIGTSTDIIGSGVFAYINALNKIIYEEKNQ